MDQLKKIYSILGEGRKEIPFIFFIFFISPLLDLIGVGSIAYFSTLATDKVRSPSVVLDIASFFNVKELIFVGILLIFLFILKFISTNYVNLKINQFSEHQLHQIRSRLVVNLLNYDYTLFNKLNTSKHIQEIHTVTTQFASGTLLSGLRLISESLIVVALGIFIFLNNGIATLAVSIIFLLFLILSDFLLRNSFNKFGSLSNLYNEKIINSLTEIVSGFVDLKIYRQEKKFHEIFRQSSIYLADASSFSKTLLQVPKYFLEFMMLFSFVLFILINNYLNSDSALLLTSLSVIAYSAIRLLPSFNAISYGISQYRLNKNDIDILYDRLNCKIYKGQNEYRILSLNTIDSISLKNISFSYDGINNILENASIDINKNDFIGLIGHSGKGKSTTINLLLGLLHPTNGSFLLNNSQFDSLPTEYTKNIALVSQNIFLPNGSIAYSICFEDINQHNFNDLVSAANQANILEYIESLPEGFNTQVGESGHFLSGGQKQRIAIARALYFKRQFLILDEPTSALDAKTQTELMKQLLSLEGSITILLVTHNHKLLSHCNKIYEISNKKFHLL